MIATSRRTRHRRSEIRHEFIHVAIFASADPQRYETVSNSQFVIVSFFCFFFV